MSTTSSGASSELEALIAFCAAHPVADIDSERFLRHLCSSAEAIIDLRHRGMVAAILDRAPATSGAVSFDLVGCRAGAIDPAAVDTVLTCALEAGSRLGVQGLELMLGPHWAPHRAAIERLGFTLAYRDLDMRCERNAFGRQVHSFEGDVEIGGFAEPFHGVFIRAPWVAEHGPSVEVLGAVDGHPVAVRSGRILAVAFHPELIGEGRLHQALLDLI